jgi:phosphonate transport system substrate-binding protein
MTPPHVRPSLARVGVALLTLVAVAACGTAAADSETADTAPLATAEPAGTTATSSATGDDVATTAAPTTAAPTTEAPAPTGPISFALPPGTDDPEAILQIGTIANYIGEITGREVVEENPADYMAVVEAMRSGFVDVALMSQFSTALAVKIGAVSPLVVWEAEQLPASLCLVDADGPIQSLEDFRGGQIAFVDPGSTTGHFMPRSMLTQAGLVYDEDYRATFAGGHDTAILALLNGTVDMACTARQLLPIFEESGLVPAGELRVVAETDPIPIGVSIVTRVDLDDATKDRLAAELPGRLMSDEAIASLFGGSTDYIVQPGFEVYEPLIQVAQDAGIDLEDLD